MNSPFTPSLCRERAHPGSLNEPRRVLLLHSSFSVVGGAELYVAALARELWARGDEVAVASVHPPRDGALLPVAVRSIGTRQFYDPGTASPSVASRAGWHAIDPVNPTGRRSLRACLEDVQPDVVHTHNVIGLGGATLRLLRNWRHVHTVHDFSLVDPRCTLTDRRGEVRTRLPLPLRVRAAVLDRAFRPDVVIFPSARVEALHRQVGWAAGERAVRVIPHGWPDPTGGAPVAAPSPSPDRPVRFLYLGRLSPHKGLELLLQGWRRFEGAGELVIAGEGPMEGIVRELAASSDNITYAGWVSGKEKQRLLRSVDCMLFPSLWPEVFPLTCAEAYLAGIPLIATDVGAPPPLVDGVNGVVAVAKPSSLGEALSRFAADAAGRARLAAGATATGRDLDWGLHVDRLQEVYRCVGS